MPSRKKPVKVTPKEFLGVTGWIRSWANLGIAGVLCGLFAYLLMIEVPSIQSRFHETLKDERDVAREVVNTERKVSREESHKEREVYRGELSKSREHGDFAAKTISQQISEQTKILDENQKRIIEEHKKGQEALHAILKSLTDKAKKPGA